MYIQTRIVEQWNQGSGEIMTALEVSGKYGIQVVFGCPTPESARSLEKFLDQTNYKIIGVRRAE